MLSLENLNKEIRRAAELESFPIDTAIYKQVKKDPLDPILCAGTPSARVCFFGRELGRDEVYAGQPLIGASGMMVREGFFEAWYGRKSKNKQELSSVLDRIFLTNTVPYKPPGNKAYATEVKERFRPLIEKLLIFYWEGNHIITLGTEAFKWFAPYAPRGEVNKYYQKDDRFTDTLDVTLTATDDLGMTHSRAVTLLPLPHPSPLNQQYYALFPDMLQYRLKEFTF